MDSPKEPLYEKIRRALIVGIDSGVWSIGTQFPTEEQIQRQYSASRGTVRRALHDLEMQGYIDRKSGKGTFVARSGSRISKLIGRIASFTQQMNDVGLVAGATILANELISAATADGRVIEAFRVPSEAQIVHIQRLRTANQDPVAIQSVYLLPDQCPDISSYDVHSLFSLYAEKYGRSMASGDEILRVSSSPPSIAGLLQIPDGAPIVIRDRITYDQDGFPFEVLHSIDRGDRWAYQYTIVDDQTRVPFHGHSRAPRTIIRDSTRAHC